MLMEETGNQKIASLFSKALDFALTKAGKDSNFKLKTEQKSFIEAVFCKKKRCARGSTIRLRQVIRFSFVKRHLIQIILITKISPKSFSFLAYLQ